MLTTAALLTAETEPTKTLPTKDALLVIKDAKFAQEKDNAQDARKDYYFTTVPAYKAALMASQLLKANVLLARTRTVLNAVKTLTTANFAKLLKLYLMLNAFLHARKEPTFLKEDAENVILNARNAKTTKLVLDARMNSI